jgi:selenocysteine-specific elongation factor
MHIIGTSGHVDHGKTALIEALTGINTDRLPEEKKRGMTIDLGFAHFEGDGGEAVGVVDVPGHERFIRNMVAGAWSLSCAVLVVAGNEGWMQQTEDHARVLEAMGTGRIICALTKLDIIERASLDAVIQDLGRNLFRLFGKEIEILPVSSYTGEGIETLRRRILEILKTIPPRVEGRSGYIHIDRAFTVKGSGTVITGSLSGGEISAGDELTILPGGRKTKIRGIQSYHSSVVTAAPVSRVACNLQGIGKEEISRGFIAARDPDDFKIAGEFIVLWESMDGMTIRNHRELEIACGTGHYTGIIHFLRAEGFARIVLNKSVPVNWLGPCLFIQQGGSRILGKGRFIWAGATDRHFRIHLSSVLERYKIGEAIREEAVLRFLLQDWFAFSTEAENKSLEEFCSSEGIGFRTIGSTIVEEQRFRKEEKTLKDLYARPGGLSRAEVLHSRDIPAEVKEFLIQEGLRKNEVLLQGNILISPEQLEERSKLSPLGKKILKLLSRKKNSGLQLKEISDPGARTELRNLALAGKVVPLEDDIYFSAGYFSRLTTILLEGLEPGSTFTIPEAKEKTGLSRRYIIPVLNKMEDMGMVRRQDARRVVC